MDGIIYECKVLTPEFKAKVDAYVETMTEDKEGYARRFKELNIRNMLNTIWNNPDSLEGYSKEEYDKVLEHYAHFGLHIPDYYAAEFKQEDGGLQTRARIMWNGEVRKIDEIDEIFSYKRKEK